MGNISTILAALFCATAPVASIVEITSQSESVQSNFQLGKETVASVRSSYENGRYNQFLSEMDEAHRNADLSGLIKMRSKQVSVEFQEDWEQQFLSLQNEKSRDLLAAIDDKDHSVFALKVRSSAAAVLTPGQEKAISKINSFISMAPGTGANEDENALIDLDLEYEYKLLHAKLPTNEISPRELRAQQIALRMEKMDKMVQASKNFGDADLKNTVKIAADTLDARLARNLDAADLNASLKKNAKPANNSEESVYSILSLYQGKFSDLMKEIDQANR